MNISHVLVFTASSILPAALAYSSGTRLFIGVQRGVGLEKKDAVFNSVEAQMMATSKSSGPGSGAMLGQNTTVALEDRCEQCECPPVVTVSLRTAVLHGYASAAKRYSAPSAGN